MKPFETIIRVQYFDTDKMQVMHHANYIRYFETARTEYLRHEGLPYSEMEKEDFQIPVLSVDAKFLTPALYDEVISVSCYMVKLGAASMELNYEVRNAETGELHVTGHSRHGFVDNEFKPIALKRKIPYLYDIFKKIYDQDDPFRRG